MDNARAAAHAAVGSDVSYQYGTIRSAIVVACDAAFLDAISSIFDRILRPVRISNVDIRIAVDEAVAAENEYAQKRGHHLIHFSDFLLPHIYDLYTYGKSAAKRETARQNLRLWNDGTGALKVTGKHSELLDCLSGDDIESLVSSAAIATAVFATAVVDNAQKLITKEDSGNMHVAFSHFISAASEALRTQYNTHRTSSA